MTNRHDGRRVGTDAAGSDACRRVALPAREFVVPSLVWIIIVVLIVLFLLGYLGRGRFRA
jgi:hypothetical protein